MGLTPASGGFWPHGHRVVRREFLHGHPWIGFATYVVVDAEDLLAVYLSSGSELAFPEWPFERWSHPWHDAGVTSWQGHGKLMLHRPQDRYSVDLFWRGEDRDFVGWYINLQDPVRRTSHGFDTLDHELDFWVRPDGSWEVKDAELFEQRVTEGRYSEEQAQQIRRTGRHVEQMLSEGRTWWDPRWAAWAPPAEWGPVTVPPGWDVADPADGADPSTGRADR